MVVIMGTTEQSVDTGMKPTKKSESASIGKLK